MSSHHGRLVSASASPAPLRKLRPNMARSSSEPSDWGRCSSHQCTVRISRSGSRFESQPGQYETARLGVSSISLMRQRAGETNHLRALHTRRVSIWNASRTREAEPEDFKALHVLDVLSRGRSVVVCDGGSGGRRRVFVAFAPSDVDAGGLARESRTKRSDAAPSRSSA